MSWPWYTLCALPYARLELPGWGRLLRALGVFADDRWSTAPVRTIRGKLHGYTMALELSNWSERHTYFLGRFYDLATQLFLASAVRAGDTFVDIGANLGMMTLLGARRVGAGGRVVALEPNPDVVRRLREAVTRNAIRNVTIHEVGASDVEEELTLQVLTEHTGMGTCTPVPAKDEHLVSNRHRVRVAPADDLIPTDLPGQMTIKIDVEGFECRAIRGLAKTLQARRPAVVAEVLDETLERAGATPGDLFRLLKTHGYEPYSLETVRARLRHRLLLRRIADMGDDRASNVAWLHPGSGHVTRLAPWMVEAPPALRGS